MSNNEVRTSQVAIPLPSGKKIAVQIGGKLGDLFDRRNVVIISGIICAICRVGLSLAQSIIPYAILVCF